MAVATRVVDVALAGLEKMMPHKMLIVEKDPAQRARIAGAAKEAGFRGQDVLEAPDLDAAQEYLQRGSFSVAILGSDASDTEGNIGSLVRAQPDCRVIALTE